MGGDPYFGFGSIGYDPDEDNPYSLENLMKAEKLRKEEEAREADRKYKESLLGKVLEPAKWFFDDAILKPVAEAYTSLPEEVKVATGALVPAVGAAQGVAGAGALAGMGMNWDPKNPEKFSELPEDWMDIAFGESLKGPAAAIETVAPVDIVSGGLGLGAKGLSAIPKAVKAAKALSTAGDVVNAAEGLYGGGLAAKGIMQENPLEAAMGFFRAGMGGAGFASSLIPSTKPNTSEVNLKLSEAVEEPARIPTPEEGYPGLEYERAAAPSEDIADPLGFLLEEPAPTGPPPTSKWSDAFRENTQQLVDEITPEVEKILGMSPEYGGEGIGKIQVILDPGEGGGGAYFQISNDPDIPHQIALNPHLMKGKSPESLIRTVLHEVSHRRTPRHEMGTIATERLAGRPPERTGELPLAGEGQVAEVSPDILAEHTRLNMEERAKITPDEYNIVQDEQALFHNPVVQEKLASFRERMNALERRTNPPPPTYEENLRAIEEGRPFPGDEERVELEDLTEEITGRRAAAPIEKAEQIEYNALKDYAREQDTLVKEAGDKFASAKTDAEKSLASQEFQKAKAERDKVATRLKQLEGKGAEARRPNVDELIEQAKRESAERKVEPAKNQAEVDKAHEKLLEEVTEEGPPSENVISTPANNLRKLLSATEMTRFNINSLAKELRAKGLEVPEDLSRQLPELVKELKDRGWVNEKLGGTYTLLAAPGKDIAGIQGKGKKLEVSNIKEGLKESIAATKKAPIIEAKSEVAPTPEAEIKPGQIHYDETGRRWDIRKVEGDKIYLERGLGGAGVRKQVIDKSEVLAKRGVMPGKYEKPQGLPEKAKAPIEGEDIEISTGGLPEKRISLEDQMKAKLTPDEIKAIGNLFGTTKKKGTAEIPEEVLMAQKAAIKARAKGEKVTEGPPSEVVTELGEGGKPPTKPPTELPTTAEGPKPKDKLEKGLIDDITDIPKTFKSAFDISWPGRQGFFLLNRKVARQGMVEGTKSIIPWTGRKNHEKIIADLENRPNAELYKATGLNQVKWEPTEDIAARSEEFASEKVSGLPGFRHSERAFNDAGNLARANMFDEFANKWQAEGKTFNTHPELYKGLADYINVLTMRKPLPAKMRQAGWILNKMFFSPMAAYSRLELINPMWYTKLPKELQKAAARDIGGTLGATVGLLGLVKAGASASGVDSDDVDVSFDPAHTQFLRLKVKETYYDLPGLTPMIRTLYRITSGRKATPKGEYKLPGGLFAESQDLEEAPFGQSAWGELGGFVENKTSPIYQALKGTLKGQGWGGKEYGFSDAMIDLFAPISVEGTIEAGKDYGLEAALRQLPDFFGISTQTEYKREPKGKGSRGKKKRPKFPF